MTNWLKRFGSYQSEIQQLMDEYNIKCAECNEETLISADSLPEYCPMCGRRAEAETLMDDEDIYIYD